MSDRGMKKWTAYKALVEQADSLQATREKKKTTEKPLISSDEAEEINEILVNYHGQSLIVQYYRNGYIYKEIITIKSIDPYEKKLVLTDGKSIKLLEIFKLNNPD